MLPDLGKLVKNRRKLITALIASTLVVLSLVGFLVWSSYQEAIQAAEHKTRDYAAIIHARLEATTQRADGDLRDMANRLPVNALSQQEVPQYAQQINANLDLHKKGFPELEAIRIFDANGDLLYTNSRAESVNANIADRPHFRKARENPTDQLVVSEVLVSRVSGEAVVVFSRALRDKQGIFRGLLTSSLKFSYFLKLFQSLNVGASGNIAIYRSDNFAQVLRWPAVEGKLNVALPLDSPTRTALPAGTTTATIEVASASDGVVRIYSYHKLEKYPFFISVGVSRNEALASWRKRSLGVGAFSLLVVALFGGLLVRLFRVERAQEQATLEAQNNGLRLAAIINTSMDAIITIDEDERIVVFNAAAEKLFQICETKVLGQTIDQFIPQRFRSGHHALIRSFATSGISVRGLKEERRVTALRVDGTEFPIDASISQIAINGSRYFTVMARDITEREKTAAERTQLAAIVESSNDAIFSRNLDGTILTWNTGAEKMLGYTAAEAIGKPINFALPANEKPFWTNNNESILRGELVTREFKHLTKDGRTISVSGSFSPLRDAAGSIVGVSGVLQDISARRESEILRAQLAAIVESSNDAIYSRALDGTILTWNAGAEKMLGYTAAEAIGQSSDLFVPGNRTPNRPKNVATLLCGEPVAHESDRLTKDGRVIEVLASHSPIRDNDGNVVASAIIAQDITSRKQSERMLRDGDQRMRLATEATGVGIWEWNLITNKVRWDNQMFGIYGVKPTNDGYVDYRVWREAVVPEELQQQEQILQDTIRNLGRSTREYRIRRHSDGELRHVEAVETVRTNSQGQVEWLIGTNLDITARKQAEAARASLEAQLRESQKMQAIGTLAGGIAHDFNNALATILGNAELARQDAANNAPILESLEEIRKAGTRARNLVQQILAFSRQQPTEKKPIDPALVVLEATRLLRATLPARLSLEVHCDKVPPVLADASQIEQVLINLVTNAMQAMQNGSGRIDIRLDTVTLDAALTGAHLALEDLRARSPEHTVRISVSDNGPGMDAATKERIFEPFFTTKPVGKGTGLGLSVVHGIVQGHGGVITVESEPGKGTTFTVYLSVAKADASISPVIPGAEAHFPVQDLNDGPRILYLDDDESLVYLVERLLKRRGYRVAAYAQQAPALRALRSDPTAFDLVLTDYNMPDMSGLEVAREVRLLNPNLPVAMTSGFIDEALRVQAADAGVRELIFKADDVAVFCELVQRLAQTVEKKKS